MKKKIKERDEAPVTFKPRKDSDIRGGGVKVKNLGAGLQKSQGSRFKDYLIFNFTP